MIAPWLGVKESFLKVQNLKGFPNISNAVTQSKFTFRIYETTGWHCQLRVNGINGVSCHVASYTISLLVVSCVMVVGGDIRWLSRAYTIWWSLLLPASPSFAMGDNVGRLLSITNLGPQVYRSPTKNLVLASGASFMTIWCQMSKTGQVLGCSYDDFENVRGGLQWTCCHCAAHHRLL